MQKFTTLVYTIMLAAVLPVAAGAQSIITYAGRGIEGNTGDGGSPIYAQIHWPTAVALDRAGNVYFADALNNTIRKISSGIITTVAGTGFGSGTGHGDFTGDGAAATAAKLSFPTGVAVDKIGNIYIADQKNNRVRRVDTSGTISTVAGNGGAAYTGDGAAAASAQLSGPTRVVLDTFGNIYIADAGNNAIRKIDVTTGNISTIAGTGVAGYNGDAVPANTSQLNNPMDVAVNDSGYVFIADTYNNRIRKVDLYGVITTVAGNGIPGYAGDGGPAPASVIYYPSGIVIDDSSRVYFSQLGDSHVRKIELNDTISTIAGADSAGYNGDNRPATTARVWFPQGLALRANGDLFIADEGNNRIRLITTTELAVNNVKTVDAGVAVYPNPSAGVFTVNVVSAVIGDQAQVIITSVTGKRVFTAAALTNQPFDVHLNEPPGMYFLTAVTAAGVSSGKLIVQ